MKRLIYLCLILTLIFNNFIYAETKTNSSSMSIQYIDDTQEIKKSSNTTKQTTTNKSNSTTKTSVQQTAYIPFTGWFQVQGTTQWVYFLRDVPLSGWQYITGGGWDGWYYFDPNSFVMLQNTYTPDHYFVGADGRWVQNYTQSNSNNITNNVVVNESTGEIINNNTNNNVKDASSKYLYNRVEYKTNSKSITSSTTLDGEALKKNIIRFTNDGSVLLPNTNKYTKLSFDYLVEEPNENNEYDLQIIVNGSLEDELDTFTKTKQTYTLEFEENSSIEFKWHVGTEDGSKTAKAVNLYIYNGILSK